MRRMPMFDHCLLICSVPMFINHRGPSGDFFPQRLRNVTTWLLILDVLNEYWHETKNAISPEFHKCAIQKLVSDVFKGLFCMLTSQLTLETKLLSSTMLSLLKQDKQFQYYDCRIWQLYSTLLNLILAFISVLFLLFF